MYIYMYVCELSEVSVFTMNLTYLEFEFEFEFWCLLPLSEIFQLYHGDQF